MARRKKEQGGALDTFMNQLARLGPIGSPNLSGGAAYPIQRLTRNYQLLNSLYRNQWLAKKIVNVIPQDMCKNWYSITAELTPAAQDRYDLLEAKYKIKEKILEGLYWGRLYGGAAAVIMIKGDEEKLLEPLELDEIMPNTFKGLLVLDRWAGIYPSTEIIMDVEDPDFGLPEFYRVNDLTTGNLMEEIHHTRIIRFEGRRLPYWEDLAELHWGASELEHVFDEMTKRDNTSWNIAGLVFQANLLVNKVAGLDQLSAMGDPEMQRDFYNLKQSQNQMRSNSSMMVIGEKDDLQAITYSFAGLKDISESQMLDVSGACDIPITRLFGRAPAGMNATGEADMQNYYDMIAAQQNSVLRPMIDQLLPIMFMSEFGKLPKDLGHKYNPIKTPSDEQMADLVKNKSDSIIMAYKENVITQRAAVTELHELSLTTNMFSSISDKNIADASDEYTDMSMGGMMGGMPGMPAMPGAGGAAKPPTGKPTAKPTPAKPTAKGKAADADFVESDHPRDDDGKFTDGGVNTRATKAAGGTKTHKTIPDYGGMPSNGGYSNSTEYEIGAKNICEAAHCILGSLHKVTHQDDPEKMRKWAEVEIEHIMEESGIIEDAIKEYGKGLYNRGYNRDLADGDEYAKETQQNIINNSPKLLALAREQKAQLDQDLPKPILRLAQTSYNVIIQTAFAMLEAEENQGNGYQNEDLREAFASLIHCRKQFINWVEGKGAAHDDKWITTHSGKGGGHHILLDDKGNIKAGAVPREAHGMPLEAWAKQEGITKTFRESTKLAKLINRKGGATFNIQTGEYRKKGSGYSVSTFPEHEHIVKFDVMDLEDQSDAIEDYLKAKEEVLKQPDCYFGAWKDTATGEVYLDVSKVVDDPAEAERLCIEHHQEAYFDFSKMEEVRVKHD